MALRNVITMNEIKQRKVKGDKIYLTTKHGTTLCTELKDWNRNFLDAKIKEN